MKIVLVSPFNIANYGAMLQGWALRTVLERLGHDVYHLDVPWLWHGIRSWWRILRSRSFNAMCFKVKLNGVIRRAFAMMGKPPVTAKYCSFSALKRNPPVADCYIAGSDQIWNINFLRSKGSADVVLLNFAPYGVKRIAYAVSCGTAQWSAEEFAIAHGMAEKVRKFDVVSSREDSGCALIKHFSGKECKWAPDPTLLLRSNDYLNLIREREGLVGSCNHIFMYILGFYSPHSYDPCLIDGVVEAIREYAGSAKPIVNVQMPDDLKTWLFKLASSDYVITNSFHGLCFSLIFHRPFVIVGFNGSDAWRNERVLCLLGRLGLRDRFVAKYDQRKVEEMMYARLCWDEIDRKVSEFSNVGMSILSAI